MIKLFMDTIGMKTCLNTVVHCYSVKLNERLLWFKANFILINILHVQNKVYLLGQCLDWTGLTQSKRILHQFGQGCETVFGSENMTLVPFVHESMMRFLLVPTVSDDSSALLYIKSKNLALVSLGRTLKQAK